MQTGFENVETVAVIVPAYQQAEFLAQNLVSVLAQTRLPDEIIVTCGDEDCAQVADRFAERHGRVHVIRGVARGLADARNVAISHARSRCILQLDADDKLGSPLFIEKVLANISPSLYALTSVGLQAFGDSDWAWDLEPYDPIELRKRNTICVCSAFTKALWKKAGGYDVSLLGCEDWAFWLACSRHDPVVQHVHERLLAYRVHRSSMTAYTAAYRAVQDPMMRLRHADFYPADQVESDLESVAAMNDPSLAAVERKVAWFPDSTACRMFRGLVRERRGDRAGAIEDYRFSAQSEPIAMNRLARLTDEAQ